MRTRCEMLWFTDITNRLYGGEFYSALWWSHFGMLLKISNNILQSDQRKFNVRALHLEKDRRWIVESSREVCLSYDSLIYLKADRSPTLLLRGEWSTWGSQIEYMLRSYPLVPTVSPWVRDIPHLKQCGSVILRFRWHLVTKMAMYDLTGYIMRSFLRISDRKTEKDLWIRRWLKEEGAIEFM